MRVVSHAITLAAGVRGVIFTAASASGTGGPVRLGLSYAGFSQVSGGNYGLSLGLVELPACALTTPHRVGCTSQHQLAFTNDAAAQIVSARVVLPGTGPVVLAAAPAPQDDGGQLGTYSATSLRPSGTWAEGGSSGSFTYSYPMPVPPAASGLVPSVSLDYDSGQVDGQTAATQAQASWIGDGWNLSTQAFIEQSFSTCSDAGGPSGSQDECYNGPILTLSQDGTSTPLVCPVSSFSYKKDSTCSLSTDNGEVVTHHVGAVDGDNGSGTKFTDYWTITERDGTTYYYGLNQLPGWASGDQATNSTDWLPVFSPDSTDPCHSPTGGFTSSSCKMAYRWNLDYVTDVHGDAMAYYYQQDTNAYNQYGGANAGVAYIRDDHLDHIDYGFTDGNAYTGHAPDQVVFTAADRCSASGTANCDPIGMHETNWPDVPYAQDNCAVNKANCPAGPTFWSTVELASVTTQQWNGSSYTQADSWALTQNFPSVNDGTTPALWLASVQHTGADTTAYGSAVTLPAVSFLPEAYANRLNLANGPALYRMRISQITTETGAVTSVTYEQADSCSTSSLPTPAQNQQSCFPVYWGTFTSSTSPDWFIKWAVQQVSVSDPTNASPGAFSCYEYGTPAWHYDDNEVVKAADRTYGQWRGYQSVTTYTGNDGGSCGSATQTQTTDTYYQGMSDDNNTTAVTLKDSQGGTHDDTNQLAGNVLESKVYNFGNGVDHSTIYSYWVSAAAATRTRSGLPDLTANATGVIEEWARQAITDTGSTTWRKTETDTTYDASPSDANFGLPLFTYRHGDLSDPSQQACTSTTYAAPVTTTTENLVGLVAETETDAEPCGGANPNGNSYPTPSQVNALTAPTGLSRPADVISDVRTYYDDPPVLSGGVPQPSDPTWPQAASTLTDGDPSVVQQATGYAGGAFSYQTTTGTAYDSYGRPVKAYDANGNKTTTSYTMTNGVTTGQTVTNALGQATATVYDPLRALSTEVTDPNGIKTKLHYDGLGRLTAVWEYGRDPKATSANLSYSYAVTQTPLRDQAAAVVTTQQLNDAGGYVTSTTLYDALLRVRQTQQPTPQGGSLISDTLYDSRGWIWKTNTDWLAPSQPGGSILSVGDSQIHDQNVTAFDGLGRPVLVTSYDASNVVSTTATAYYGDRVTTVPPLGGTPTSTVTDALGRTTELDSYTSAPTVTTSGDAINGTVTISGGTSQPTDYTYNHRGWLSGITDASTSQSWTKSYNLLGQVTGTTDPSGGATSMSYDPNGNLTSTTGADNHTISYSYDALNRKTGEYDGPSTSSPQLASWVYDNSNNFTGGVTDPIGHLTTETSYSGGNAYTIQQTGFNQFGESLGETVTLPADTSLGALSGTSYTLGHTYSSGTGLLQHDMYPASPDGGALPAETVIHGYEPGFDLPAGIVSALGAYSQNIAWSANFQVAKEEVGSTSSNTDVNNLYDPHTGNLTDTQIENSAGTTTYDHTHYSYDPAGNITAQTDTRNGTTAETQCFGYDTLDRLTQAWTATDNCAASPSTGSGGNVGDQIPGSAYWTSWKYDPLGNTTKQTSHSLTGGQDTVTSYAYDGNGASQPDTLTATATTGPSGPSTASYTYDPAGNTLTRDQPSGNEALTWTHDGKPATDTTSAGTTSYTYDADGNLLLQKDPGQTTLYLFGGSEQITLSGGTVTGTRILPLEGGGEVVRTGGGSNYNFEFTDQHGTGLLTLDNTTQNPTWRQYTPYGAPRGKAPSNWPDSNGFLNQPADANTTLTTLGARQYDPTTGRFQSLDPILDPSSPQQLNGYSYAADNPVSQADPSGLCTQFPDCNNIPQPGSHQPGKTDTGGGEANPSAPSDYYPPGGYSPYYPSYDPRSDLFLAPVDPSFPDFQPVAAASVRQSQQSPLGPDCNGITFRLGACVSEAAAAGNTAQEVQQSAIGAAGVIGGAALGPAADVFGSWIAELLAPRAVAYAAEEGSAAIVSRVAGDQAARGPAYLQQFLSGAELQAMARSPGVARMFLGQAVHRATDAALQASYPGRFIYNLIGPDFLDTTSEGLVELTTPGQVAAHIARGSDYLSARYATYQLP